MKDFQITSNFQPCGDQPQAIEKLVRGLRSGERCQTLLGVTGSGKTFSMAEVIQEVKRPTLIIAPNKTLAAQLYSEFKVLFPQNAVEYFVSYYDYYQPEAYVPRTDTFIEKDSAINEDIDKMRHSATRSLLERRDVIIVASVSCIYGLGSPEAYHGMLVDIQKGMTVSRTEILNRLVEIQYERNDIDFHRGTFRVRGDVVEIFPAYEEDRAVRMEFFGDEIDQIVMVDPLRGETIEKLDRIAIYPGSHFVTPEDKLKTAMELIRVELKDRVQHFKDTNKLLEAQRIEQRTLYDLEMIEEIGFCSGIENYSRHLTGRKKGAPPPTLLEYFPKDFLLFIDESHVTVPQIGGMYKGDRSRKETLVEYGFRLPSALDNRPLQFDEFEKNVNQMIYVSATPGPFELAQSKGSVVEQIIRPTGLLDPEIEVRPVTSQVDDLYKEIKERSGKNERTLVTTLTKRFAEDLAEHYAEMGLKVKYMHSDIATLERTQIIRELRLGEFDALIGINLLREGLDIPEVTLVAILDADKEGFLRSSTSLIQTSGRAARNISGKVIMYADTITSAMQGAISETARRRKIQTEYNRKHNITPVSIKKLIQETMMLQEKFAIVPLVAEEEEEYLGNRPKLIANLETQMYAAARNLEFEKAAELRDRITKLKEKDLGVTE